MTRQFGREQRHGDGSRFDRGVEARDVVDALRGENSHPVTVARYDAMETGTHQAFADEICAGGVPDLVIAATGVLTPQQRLEQDLQLAATMIETNLTGHVTALLAFGEAMRRQETGAIR